MSDKEPLGVPPSQEGERWTRPEDYLDLGRLWRRSAARNRKLTPPRTEPEQPRHWLGTVPFLALMAVLAFLAVAIMIVAWPGRTQREPQVRSERAEPGTAPRGWLEAAKEEARTTR